MHYRVYNIGNNKPVELMGFIETIENAVSKKVDKKCWACKMGM